MDSGFLVGRERDVGAQESQRRHVKVTEVATEVVAAYSGEEPKTKASN